MTKIERMLLLVVLFASQHGISHAQEQRQWVEGFDTVEFRYNNPPWASYRDFRGNAPGYMTAAWWAPGQMKDNRLSWKTAAVPAKAATTFSFIAATSVLPSEFTLGPKVKLSVNGKYALSFRLGYIKDFTWTEGDYTLKYISKRVEYPYFSSHRQFDLNGNSGIYQLTVPASAVEAGKPVVLQVEIQPFERWNNGWFMVKGHKDVLKQSMEILEGEIEALRMDMAVVNMQTQVLATQVYSDMLGGNKFKHEIIYSNGYRHEHPADIIKLKNGEMLLMTREAMEHIAQDGDVVMLRSKDGGKTWGDRKVVANVKNMDEREGCAVQLQDGTILMGVFFNNLYVADGSYKNLEARRREGLDVVDSMYLGAYIITSTDNGHTWSKPNYIDTKKMPFANLEGPTDAPILMPDGSILMGIIGYSPNDDKGNRSSVMLRSVDKGKTWQYVSTIAADPGGKLGGFMEPGIVRTKTGRIVAVMRNHAKENFLFSTYSDDDGKTWAPVAQTDMVGHPADIIQLADGRLLCTYGIRTSVHARPAGIRACFSSDNGKTWDIKTEVQLRNDFLNLDIGYPESIQMPDGNVMTVYYFNLFGKFYIGATRWKP